MQKFFSYISQAADSSRDEITDLLEKIVSIKSYSRNEKELADFLISFFKSINISVFRTPRGSVLALMSPHKNHLENLMLKLPQDKAFREHIAFLKERNIETIAFNAHMDVVGEGRLDNWTSDPFVLRIEEDRMYGRGTADMKGALTAMAYAFKLASNAEYPLKNAILGCFVTEEEAAEGLAMEEILDELKIFPDAVLLGEPTDMDIALGQRGRLQFSLIFHGKRAHTSVPELGSNAMYPLASDILAIDNLDRKEYSRGKDGDMMKRTTLVVTNVSCDPSDASSVIVYAQADARARLAENETMETLLEKLRKDVLWIEPEVKPYVYDKPSYTGVLREWSAEHSAWKTDKNHPFAQKVSKCLKLAVKDDFSFKIWPFSTDGVTSAARHSIPTVGLGPGEEKACHIADEYVSRENFFKAVTVYTLLAFC